MSALGGRGVGGSLAQVPVPRPRVPGRSLADVAARVGATGPDALAQTPTVTGVALDSRRVQPGDLYAALPGTAVHGARFTTDAAAAGAVAVLTDPAGSVGAQRCGLPVLVVPDPRAVLGPLSAWVYGDPAGRLLLLGVTGTNGKTTTTSLLEGALTAAGRCAGLIGTTGARVAGEALPSVRTTPEAPDLHALLALMVARGVVACALEVSSHAVVMHRVDGLVLDVVGFTQLSQDHLDLHGTMEAYFAAKAALFTPARARAGVVVVDDAWGRRLADLARAEGLPVTTVATAAPAVGEADHVVVPGSVRPRADGRPGSVFTLAGARGEVELHSPLPGAFNVTNTALAHVVLLTAGLPADVAAAGLGAATGPPGRMEVVGPGARGPGGSVGGVRGVVDYAHTPDAVAAALAALRPTTAGLLVVVLGAGGDRDRGKRAAMGEAAAAGADAVVVTDDNPRSEDPAAIRAAVLDGALRRGGARVLEVADRREAVAAAVAVAAAAPGSTVLLAGKGHEQGQEVAGAVLPFDDRVVLAEVLAACAPGGRA